MARILLIETSTAQLSTALAEDGVVTAFRICGEPRMQAALTAPYVKEVLDEKGLTVKDLEAVCVGRGPGSYTGLRVGVSTAKGLCFGAGIPLLSADTLDVLVQEAHRLGVVPDGCHAIVPMVDARRMEVYAALYDRALRPIREVQADVVDADTYREYLDAHPVYFFGNGAQKCMETIDHPNAHYIDGIEPLARWMQPLAERRMLNEQFEDVAYFEPFYLKDFVAKMPKKLI